MENITRKGVLHGAAAVLAVFLCTLFILLAFSVGWMLQTWTNLTVDELVYHLKAPLEGTNQGMLLDYLNRCAVPSVLICLVLIILLVSFRKNRKYYKRMVGASLVISLAAAAGMVSYAWNSLDAGSYVQNQGSDSKFVEEHYVDPSGTEISFPERKRNLIYIYLESMEVTYADKKNGGAYDENYIPELTELAQEYIDFSGEETEMAGGYSMPGTTWTVAGMFAQTAGLPLNISIDGNSMDTQDSFFDGALALGDILDEAGYSQTLLIGSDAAFGGRKQYFTEHGGYEMADYGYAMQEGWIPEGYSVWWGYEDEKLFDAAKEKLSQLAEADEPFNLTMLTADTHFEDGYLCPDCPDEYDNQYANVIACSSRRVARFIRWIQDQPFYENTTIILSGDHPTMDSDFCEDISDDYERKVYTCYVNAPKEEALPMGRDFTTFDLFPTTLASLDVSIKGDRLGLGTNLFSSELTLTERYGIDKTEKELSKKSTFLEQLADINADKPEMMVRNDQNLSTIEVGAYEVEEGKIPLTVSGLVNTENQISSVLAAVWTGENQEDLQWLQLEGREDGSYYTDIFASNFGNYTGQYFIHIYIVDEYGSQYLLGEAGSALPE